MHEILVKVIKSYYWLTFLFLFLDKAFGIDLRVSGFIYTPYLQNVYYAFCFLCLGLILWKPSLTFPVGLLESSVNMTVLCIGIMLPIYSMPGALAEGATVNPITWQKILNFIIAGLICVWSFHGYLRLSGSQSQGRAGRD
jgi:hypothetical protein